MIRMLTIGLSLAIVVGVVGCGSSRTAELPKNPITDTAKKTEAYTSPTIPKPPGS